MNVHNKFKNFLHTLKNDNNSKLLEAIESGFTLIEGEEEKFYEKTLTFNFRSSEDSMKRLLDLFKAKQRGILILDPDADMEEPTTSFVLPQRKPSDAGVNRYLIYEDTITEPNDDGDRDCTIIIKSNEKEKVDTATENLRKLVDNIGGLGNGGHYFEIWFVPINRQAKQQTIGWDGDGSDWIDIKSIKIT